MNQQQLLSAVLLSLILTGFTDGESRIRLRESTSNRGSLCAELIQPAGYQCFEHTAQTTDGYLLALQRVWSRNGNINRPGPPVLLLHGLFMGGDCWFLNSPEQSLGFILADQGFDVWVGNVRGTYWSRGHIYLSEFDTKYWDWSWQELALNDLTEMLHFIHSETSSKAFIVGHSQGTIMSLAGLTQPNIVKMVEAAALLCPISYLEHVTAPFARQLVTFHIDQLFLAAGIHELNLRSKWSNKVLDFICDHYKHCDNVLDLMTGYNCCFNNSRVDFYLDYEPNPTSAKNLAHLFQMIRKGTFARYDYGIFKNYRLYGQTSPPEFDLGDIPDSFPLWMGYGGRDGLADVEDFNHTLRELRDQAKLLYLDHYGHVDFLLSVRAKQDVYDHMIEFFRSVMGRHYVSSTTTA